MFIRYIKSMVNTFIYLLNKKEPIYYPITKENEPKKSYDQLLKDLRSFDRCSEYQNLDIDKRQKMIDKWNSQND